MGVKAEVFGPGRYEACANRVKKLTGIVLIFHPGCGHCVQMRPEWEKMKRGLSPGSKIVEVDGSEMSGNESMNRSPLSGTGGFPEIVRMKNGTIEEKYQGPRTAEYMGEFAEKAKGTKKMSKSKSKSKGKRKTRRKKNKSKKRR